MFFTLKTIAHQLIVLIKVSANCWVVALIHLCMPFHKFVSPSTSQLFVNLNMLYCKCVFVIWWSILYIKFLDFYAENVHDLSILCSTEITIVDWYIYSLFHSLSFFSCLSLHFSFHIFYPSVYLPIYFLFIFCSVLLSVLFLIPADGNVPASQN